MPFLTFFPVLMTNPVFSFKTIWIYRAKNSALNNNIWLSILLRICISNLPQKGRGSFFG